MSERPRCTVQIDLPNDGVAEEGGGGVEIYLNRTALDRLIAELSALSERNDHFHMAPAEWGGGDGGDLSLIPYQDGSTVAGHLKVLFRPDEWDERYFPHVLHQADE